MLTFRLARPLVRSLRHDLRVHAVVPETPGVTSVYAAGTWIGCRSAPGSSSAGGSSAGAAGPGPSPTRCRPHPADGDVFVCGPEPWMDSVVATLRAAEVPAAHIHLERFGW